jgi:PAS domain S-box-containing protein
MDEVTMQTSEGNGNLLLEIQRSLGIALSECSSLDEGLQICLQAVIEAVDGDGAGIYFYDSKNRALNLAAHAGLSESFVQEARSFDATTPQTALIEAKSPAYLSAADDGEMASHLFSEHGFRTLGAIPILSHFEVIGALNVASRKVGSFDVHARLAIESITAQVGNAIVRLQLAEQLFRRERLYRNLLLNANDLILIHEFSPDGIPGRILEASRAACEFYGLSAQELYDHELLDLTEPEERSRIETCIQQLMHNHRVTLETRSSRADGSVRILDVESQIINSDDRIVAMSVMRDITERRKQEEALLRSEQELQALAKRLAETSEAERRMVASELHDGITQTITGVRYSLESLLKELPDDTPSKLTKRAQSALNDLGIISGQIRDVISELRPPSLEHFGLTAALKAYTERLAFRYGTNIDLCGDDIAEDVAEDAVLGLYRIGQESITNACQHAAADHISVSVEQDGTILRLCVADDGHGFDTDHTPTQTGRHHLGLITMKERASAMGGQLTITSKPEHGTEVTVEVQLPARNGS